MDITLRIQNLPGQPAAQPTPPPAAAAVPPPPTQPSAHAATGRASDSAPRRPEFQSSLVSAIGRLQIRLGPPPHAGTPIAPSTATAPVAAPFIAPAAPVAGPTPRPVIILGAIPLAKNKAKRRPVPADPQVIPLVLPDYIEPEEVRGRVPLQAQEFETEPAADESPAPQPADAIQPQSPLTPTAPVMAETPTPALIESPVAHATDGAAATVENAAAEAPPAPKILVRPGPDIVAPKKTGDDQTPEETPEERIARIKREDEEMRTDERKILKFANDAGKLSSMVEVILFQNAKPLTINQIARALPGKVNPKQLRQSLRLCSDRFDRGEHPIELVEIAGGWQLVVRSGFQELIETFSGAAKKRTITGSIMETLAIIAYRQGTTKVEIETLRGINDCSPHLRQLTEMGLIASGRRTDLPGSPFGYWTTPLFMRAVGIRSLEELGKMGEFTPTEVAGLVEIEAPSDEEIAQQQAEAAANAEAGPADETTTVTSAEDNTNPQSGDEDDAAVTAIDPDAIDAAMSPSEAADTQAEEPAAEPEAASADLFGDAVVIPVDPADVSGGAQQPRPAEDPLSAEAAKKSRKRKSEQN